MSLKSKILLIFAIGGTLPLIVMSLIEYVVASNALGELLHGGTVAVAERAKSQLVAVRDTRRTQVLTLLKRIENDIVLLSENPFTANALRDLQKAFAAARGFNKGKHLLNQKAYTKVHNIYQPYFEKYIQLYEFYDLFIFNLRGDLVYTVVKEPDFTLNFVDGQYSSSGLGEVFREAVKGKMAVRDFEPYAPSNNDPAAFIAVPIRGNNGVILGVLGLQFSIDAISRVMGESSGMGKSGETYLVGTDHKLRSNSRLDSSLTVNNSFHKNIQIDTEAVRDALSGKTNAKEILDYRGIPVLSAYTPLNFHEIKWGLMAEIDVEEAHEAVVLLGNEAESAKTYILLWTLPVLAASLGIGVILVFFINSISKSIQEAVSQLQSTGSELESVARQQATAATEQTTSINEVSTTTQELVSTSKQIATNTQQVSETAQKTVESGQQGNNAVGNARNGMEKTKHQVQLIAQHMLDLGNKSQRIGVVLEIINELSEQTNLLSLNATIEAAGAGEAGQRFAVVADEVRKLAERSAESTKEIKDLITDIQQTANTTIMVTEDGTKAVDEGVNLFDDVSSRIAGIVSQAESTSMASREIELTTRQQTTSVEQVSTALNDLNLTAKQTEQSANQTLETVKMLVDMSNNLERLV